MNHPFFPMRLPGCFARLKRDYPQASPESVLIYQDEALQLASLLLQMTRTKLDALRELQALFHQHPDYPIFSSLPGAGELLGPDLLEGSTPGSRAQHTLTSRLAEALPIPLLEEWAEALWDVGLQKEMIGELIAAGECLLGY